MKLLAPLKKFILFGQRRNQLCLTPFTSTPSLPFLQSCERGSFALTIFPLLSELSPTFLIFFSHIYVGSAIPLSCYQKNFAIFVSRPLISLSPCTNYPPIISNATTKHTPPRYHRHFPSYLFSIFLPPSSPFTSDVTPHCLMYLQEPIPIVIPTNDLRLRRFDRRIPSTLSLTRLLPVMFVYTRTASAASESSVPCQRFYDFCWNEHLLTFSK